jgi:hypothetical protein
MALSFGSVGSPVPQGTVSGPQSLTLANNGSASLVISGFAFDGAHPDDFTTGADSCHGAVAPGSSCAVRVRFAPQAQGARSAALTVLSNAPTSTPIMLSGTAGPLPQGATGAAGATGAQGPQGPPGDDARTPQGRLGKDAKVTCTVRNKAKTNGKGKVTCVVRLVTARHGGLRWRLVRHGRTYGQGVVFARKGPRVNRLRPGRYVLRIGGRARGTAFAIG